MSTKRKATLALVAIGVSLSLVACSSAGRTIDSDSTQSGSSSSSPALNSEQVGRIVDEIQAVIDQAETDDDADVLEERLTNPALIQRQSQMSQASTTGDELSDLTLSMKVYSATVDDSWPRALVLGTEATSSTPARIYVITQESAQSDYQLENWVRLIGGNSVTGISVEAGSRMLSDDAEGYLMTPAQTLETFINLLNDSDNEEYQVFDDSTLSETLASELSSLNDTLEGVGEVTIEASDAGYPLTAVVLASGEALVSGGFTYTYTYARTEAGSQMEVSGTAASYLDDPSVVSKVVVTYTVNVLFTVPLADSEDTEIKVIGSERSIISVEKDDSNPPD